MYYIGENSIDLIIKLIDEIENKKKTINKYYKRLNNYKKIKDMLDRTSMQYFKERDEVLNYLKNYKDINPDEYSKITHNIRALNNHNYYGRINDNDISTFISDEIDLDNTNDCIIDIYTYKEKITDNILFIIPRVSETMKISDDSNFMNAFISVYTKYEYIIKLKDTMIRYNKLKKLINSNKVNRMEKEKYKHELKQCGIQMRTLKNIVLGFFEENPELEIEIKSYIKSDKKITWIEIIKYAIPYFRKIYIPRVLKQLSEELELKNKKSVNYCDTIINYLYTKSENVGNNILDTATKFNQGYILNYMDSIYPGIKEELVNSLKTNNIERINYLESIIINTLYLEDNDYDDEKIKCL